MKWSKLAGTFALCAAVFCSVMAGQTGPANSTSSQPHRKPKAAAKKTQKPPPTPLPSGPTGPVQQVPLDSMAPVPPQVSYQNDQLTIVAPNSTLGDILRAVRKQTGAEIDVPSAPERVVTRLGPGPAREVIADLLNGSRFNYVLLGSPADNNVLTRVVLVPKTGSDAGSQNAPEIAQQPQPGMGPHTGNPGAPLPERDNAADATDDSADDAAAAAEQPAPTTEPEQPAQNSEQPVVKTPQQMLQEMQQRQLQLQQQQQQGQQPPPPPRPQEQ